MGIYADSMGIYDGVDNYVNVGGMGYEGSGIAVDILRCCGDLRYTLHSS